MNPYLLTYHILRPVVTLQRRRRHHKSNPIGRLDCDSKIRALLSANTTVPLAAWPADLVQLKRLTLQTKRTLWTRNQS